MWGVGGVCVHMHTHMQSHMSMRVHVRGAPTQILSCPSCPEHPRWAPQSPWLARESW